MKVLNRSDSIFGPDPKCFKNKCQTVAVASSADDVDVDVSQESRLKQIGLNSEFEILLFYFSVERIKLK